LSRLLAMYVEATQELHRATQEFLGTSNGKVPYIIGIAGSVAVGKSTTARVLRALLSRWPNTPKVDLVTTDGFLYPNAVLQEQKLMERKGFPESYDTQALLQFLANVKAGHYNVTAPVYSHLTYDVVSDQFTVVDNPDILIVEGLNVLQPGRLGSELPVVSDYFDFSIYLDAKTDILSQWYIDRFMTLRDTAFRDPRSYFKRYASFSDEEARAVAKDIWTKINLRNLYENILPTRARAGLILTKGQDHQVSAVALRKL
ncbi:MAG: type I pantothenate kinase, partial [Hyphomicrobiales bacterium]|nr:type I pantothenate kinase [Hyphomicrobiales bacterium]